MRLIIGLISLTALLTACESKNSENVEKQAIIHKAVVQEALQAGEFIYLRTLENNNEKWIATPSFPVELGLTYYFKNSMVMSNFESKNLNRTFKTIYFVEKISTDPSGEIAVKTFIPDYTTLNQQTTTPVFEEEKIIIEPGKNTITIAELFKNKKIYESKIIKVKGMVTKYNPAILNKNWIHLHDGTEYSGEFDLAVTTDAEVEIGDIITVEGKVYLDKDYGAGYYYKLIIEDAVIVD